MLHVAELSLIKKNPPSLLHLDFRDEEHHDTFESLRHHHLYTCFSRRLGSGCLLKLLSFYVQFHHFPVQATNSKIISFHHKLKAAGNLEQMRDFDEPESQKVVLIGSSHDVPQRKPLPL